LWHEEAGNSAGRKFTPARIALVHISVGADMSKTFYGKYRGTVINNIDPL
jgi:hypothetical protein